MADPYTVCPLCKDAMRRSALNTHTCAGPPTAQDRTAPRRGAATVEALKIARERAAPLSTRHSPHRATPHAGSNPQPTAKTTTTTVQNTRTNKQRAVTASPPPRTPPDAELRVSARPSGSSPRGSGTRLVAGERSPIPAATASPSSFHTKASPKPSTAGPTHTPEGPVRRVSWADTSASRERSATAHSLDPVPPRIRISLSEDSGEGEQPVGSAPSQPAVAPSPVSQVNEESLDDDAVVEVADRRTSNEWCRPISSARSSPSSATKGGVRLPATSSSPSTEAVFSRVDDRNSEAVLTSEERMMSEVRTEEEDEARHRRGPRSLKDSLPPHARQTSPLPLTPPSPPQPQLPQLTDYVEAAVQRLLGAAVRAEVEAQLTNRAAATTAIAAAAEERGAEERRHHRADLAAALVDVVSLKEWREEQSRTQAATSHKVRELQQALAAATARSDALAEANAALRNAVDSLARRHEAAETAREELLAEVREQWAALRGLATRALDSSDELWAALEARDRAFAERLATMEERHDVVAAAAGAEAGHRVHQALHPRETTAPRQDSPEPRGVALGAMSPAGAASQSSLLGTSGEKCGGGGSSPTGAIRFGQRVEPQQSKPQLQMAHGVRATPPPLPAVGPHIFSDIGLLFHTPEPRVAAVHTVNGVSMRLPSPAPVRETSTATAATALWPKLWPASGADRVVERLRGPPTVVVPQSQWPGSNLSHYSLSLPQY